MSYKVFMRETGIVPLTVAILLGLSGHEMTKEFVRHVTLPIFHALKNMEKPMLNINDFIGSVMVFLLAVAVSIVLIKTFNLHKKTIETVRVADDE
jgi:large-conductance mechanosensitive channel